MTFQWFLLPVTASLKLPTLPLEWALFLLLLIPTGALLFSRRVEIDRYSMFEWLGLLILLAFAPVTVNGLLVDVSSWAGYVLLPFPLLGLVAISLAGVSLGTFAGICVGLVTGLAWAFFHSHNPSDVLVFGLMAGIVGIGLNQLFRGLLGDSFRIPLVMILLAALIVLIPLLIMSTIAGGEGTLPERLEKTITQSPWLLLGNLGMALIAGVTTQGMTALLPRRIAGEPLVFPPWSRSLSQRLLWFTLPLTTGIILMLVITVALTSYRVATQVVMLQMAKDAQTAGAGIPFFFQAGRGLIDDLADELASSALPQSQILEAGIQTVPFFEQLLYIDASTGEATLYPFESSFPSVLTPQEEGRARLILNDPIPAEAQSSYNGNLTVSFLAPVTSADTSGPSGIVIGRTVPLDNLLLVPTRDLLSNGSPGQGLGYLMDSDGVVLWHGSEPNRMGEQIGFSRAQDLSRLIPDGQAYRIHEADASHTLLVMLPVEGQSSWIIALELPNAIVVDLALQSALPTLVLLTLVSLLALLGMAVSVRGFSTALDDLSAAVERIRQGDLSVPLMGSGEDEIGKLGRGIATMQHELQRRVDEQDRLLNVTRAVAANLELFRAMPSILNSALEITSAAGVRIVLRSPHGEALQTYQTGDRASGMAQLDAELIDLVERQGILVISRLDRAGNLNTEGIQHLIQSLVAFPLRGDNAFYGIIWLGYARSHLFNESEMNFLSTLSGQAATAVANARLLEEVTERRRELEAVLESTHDGIIVTDINGRVLIANPAVSHLIGVRREQVRGKPAKEVFEIPELVETLTDYQTPVSELEITGISGQAILVSTAPMMNRGALLGRVAVMRDVTALKELDNIKTVFLRMVSHDLRSPLTYMRGYLSMLEILGQINERQREAVEKIEIGISHITDMTHRLTYLSRLEFGEKIDLEYAYIDVPTLLKEIGNEMEIALRDTRITYEVKSAENLPLLKADVILLRQVLANLIGNAIKYIGKGDRITARCDQPEPASYRIEIIDNGPGIRAEDQAHLFKAFYRAKHHPGDPDPPTGSGLGLALVRAIVEAHGGSVEVHSEFGKGAAFQLILPVARL